MQLFVFDPAGDLVYGPDTRQDFPDDLVQRILADRPGGLAWLHTGQPLSGPVLPVFDLDGQLTGVEADPDYAPPAAASEPVTALAAKVDQLSAAVAANLLASPHDRRWLAQKERAKLFGVGWIRANPACDQAALETALSADLAAAFPDQPLVVAAGVILSYAAEAHARGYTADPGFAALRDLIVATSDSDLQAMLSVL